MEALSRENIIRSVRVQEEPRKYHLLSALLWAGPASTPTQLRTPAFLGQPFPCPSRPTDQSEVTALARLAGSRGGHATQGRRGGRHPSLFCGISELGGHRLGTACRLPGRGGQGLCADCSGDRGTGEWPWDQPAPPAASSLWLGGDGAQAPQRAERRARPALVWISPLCHWAIPGQALSQTNNSASANSLTSLFSLDYLNFFLLRVCPIFVSKDQKQNHKAICS